MTSEEFMRELEERGYNVEYDEVVTVMINSEEQDPEDVKEVIRELGWNRSYGIKFTK